MMAPPHTMLSVQQFLTQNNMIPNAPPSLFTQSHPDWLFLFPQMKKVLKGRRFADVEEVNQKTETEALQGIKTDEFKNCFEQWQNISIGILYPMESTLKVTEV